MGTLSEYLNEHRSRREPPYRPLAVINEVKAFLEEEADVAASVLAGPLSDSDSKPGEAGYQA